MELKKFFAYIKDIVPTLLEITSTPDHKGVYLSKKIWPITGKSLLPVLTGSASYTHDKSASIGYELSGNAALYQGDYKLLRNLPPLGDGEWHLYDIVKDPGESKDLRNSEKELFVQMLQNYNVYAKDHGVQEMPHSYNYIHQVILYSAKKIFYRNWPYLGIMIGFIILGLVYYKRR